MSWDRAEVPPARCQWGGSSSRCHKGTQGTSRTERRRRAAWGQAGPVLGRVLTPSTDAGAHPARQSHAASPVPLPSAQPSQPCCSSQLPSATSISTEATPSQFLPLPLGLGDHSWTRGEQRDSSTAPSASHHHPSAAGRRARSCRHSSNFFSKETSSLFFFFSPRRKKKNPTVPKALTRNCGVKTGRVWESSPETAAAWLAPQHRPGAAACATCPAAASPAAPALCEGRVPPAPALAPHACPVTSC